MNFPQIQEETVSTSSSVPQLHPDYENLPTYNQAVSQFEISETGTKFSNFKATVAILGLILLTVFISLLIARLIICTKWSMSQSEPCVITYCILHLLATTYCIWAYIAGCFILNTAGVSIHSSVLLAILIFLVWSHLILSLNTFYVNERRRTTLINNAQPEWRRTIINILNPWNKILLNFKSFIALVKGNSPVKVYGLDIHLSGNTSSLQVSHLVYRQFSLGGKPGLQGKAFPQHQDTLRLGCGHQASLCVIVRTQRRNAVVMN